MDKYVNFSHYVIVIMSSVRLYSYWLALGAKQNQVEAEAVVTVFFLQWKVLR